MNDEERRETQRKEFEEYKGEMRDEVKEIKDSIFDISRNQAIAQKDTTAILTVVTSLHKRLDEFDKVIFKGNGRLSILETLAVHSSWIKLWGTVSVLIIAGIVVGYFQLSAAPPIVAVEVISSK